MTSSKFDLFGDPLHQQRMTAVLVKKNLPSIVDSLNNINIGAVIID